MKTDKKAKDKIKAEKLKIRVIGRTPEKVKKWPTGELELFRDIALLAVRKQHNNAMQWYVLAKHIDFLWRITEKLIRLEDLTPTNFSHRIPKSRWEEYRLDPDNIEIVSMAYHHYEHTKQILKIDYPN